LFFDQMWVDTVTIPEGTRKEFVDQHIFYDGKYISTGLLRLPGRLCQTSSNDGGCTAGLFNGNIHRSWLGSIYNRGCNRSDPMKIHDVTLTITPDLVTWPGDPNVVLERVNKIEDGANANVSRMDMGVHTGTHVDAPVHFLPGQAGIETLDLNTLVGPVRVMSCPKVLLWWMTLL
jgi:hypothetical protein